MSSLRTRTPGKLSVSSKFQSASTEQKAEKVQSSKGQPKDIKDAKVDVNVIKEKTTTNVGKVETTEKVKSATNKGKVEATDKVKIAQKTESVKTKSQTSNKAKTTQSKVESKTVKKSEYPIN